MSFQDVENSAGRPSPTPRPAGGGEPTSQAVAAGIFQINTGVSGFRRLVDAIGTSKDTPDHRHKLHNTRQRIVQLVKETSALLKSLCESKSNPNVNQNVRIEQAKLAKDFQTSLVEFQRVQQLASEHESTYSPILHYHNNTTPTAIGGGEASMEQEKQPFLMEHTRQEVLLLENEIAFNDAITEEREQGIIEIEYQIGQTNEIFKDLAVVVHQQGVVIDDIESNVEGSSAATTQARVQLSKASKTRKSKCSWCWWVLGIVAVITVIGFVIIILV